MPVQPFVLLAEPLCRSMDPSRSLGKLVAWTSFVVLRSVASYRRTRFAVTAQKSAGGPTAGPTAVQLPEGLVKEAAAATQRGSCSMLATCSAVVSLLSTDCPEVSTCVVSTLPPDSTRRGPTGNLFPYHESLV